MGLSRFPTVIDSGFLSRVVRYHPETGLLTWKAREPSAFSGSFPERDCATWNGRFAGKPAFDRLDGHGRKVGMILCPDGRQRTLNAHAVVLFLHGIIVGPDQVVDHINGDPADNRLSNLRVVTQGENMRNMKRVSTNTSGVPGVGFHKAAGKWTAEIYAQGSKEYLGLFDTRDAAVAARKAAEARLGYHANHGRC